MSLSTRRLLFILFNCFTFAVLSAQTLYWVGGSGNFNDPLHWSLSPNVASTGEYIPNANSSVIFNASGNISVSLETTVKVKSIVFESGNTFFFSKTNQNVELIVTEEFSANSSVHAITMDLTLKFEGNSNGKTGLVNSKQLTVNEDFLFVAGSWKVDATAVSNVRALKANNSSVEFSGSTLFSQTLDVSNNNVVSFDNVRFFVGGKVELKGNNQLTSNTSFINRTNINQWSTGQQTVSTGGNGKVIGGGGNQTMVSFCSPSFTVTKPSCSPGCDGKIAITIPSYTSACWAPSTPTSVYVTVASGTCNSVAGLSNVAAGIYTLTNVCNCSNDYVLLLFDHTYPGGSSFLESINVSVTQPVINSFIAGQKAITTCNSVCDGSVSIVWIGGLAPYSYTVSPPLQTQTVYTSPSPALTQTGICAGTLTITSQDANQCKGTFVSTFIQPSAIVAPIATKSIACKGDCTGSFSVTPSGGNPNYTVQFSNSISTTTTPSVTVSSGTLCAGIISATVTDVNGCTLAVAPQNIAEPTASLSMVLNTTSITCNTSCNGSATVNTSGGTSPYNYSWTPVATNASVISGLCVSAGTETLTITDFNNCSISRTFVINQPPAITLTPTQTNVVCSGSCSGVASVAASGGVGSFIYTWVGPLSTNTILSGSSNSVTNLCAGTYTAFVRDSPNNCQSTVAITITQPPAVTLAIVTKSVSCFGLSDGGATVTASGGNNAFYTYSWTPGAMTTSAISTFSAGNYNLTVFDAQSCPTNTSVAIIQPTSGLTASSAAFSLSCNAANAPCNGTITVSPTGGTTPYQYTLTTSSTVITTAPPYTGLCAGNYTVSVMDAALCPTTPSVLTVNQPTILVPSPAVTSSVSCFNGTNGAVSGTATGGTPAYSFTWTTPSSGNFFTSTVNNLPAGIYTLNVRDSHSCTASNVITVNQPTADISITLNTNSITCFALCNGVLNSTVTGGTAPYMYSWTNSSGSLVSTAPTATGLCPGSYTLTVIDFNLCTKTNTTVVLSPGPIVMTQTATPVACFGNANGSATVNATGGTPSFSYSFNSSPVVNNLTGVLSAQPSGTYIATATDNAGCTRTISFVITTPTVLVANITGSVGSCNVCNGMATVTPSGGTSTYNAVWTGTSGSVGTATNVTGLCPGNYTVTVTDSHSCIATNTVAIQQIVSVTVVPAGSSILCNGATTGSASVTAGGGIPGYTYSWTAVGSTPPVSGQTSATLTAVGAGTYAVVVLDNTTPSACSNSATIVLTQPPAMTVTATQTNVSCFGFTNAAISTTANGGTMPVNSYSWASTPAITSPGTRSITGLGVSSGTSQVYTLTVRDNNLCPTIATYTITQPSSITVSTSSTNPTNCGLPNGNICVSPSGGSGAGYTYSWSPVTGTNTGTGFCMNGLGGGNYQVVVTDNASCTNTFVISLVNANGPTITVTSRSVDCFGASTGAATVIAGGVGPFAFAWTPTLTVSNTSTSSIASSVQSNTYNVSITDAALCVTNTVITIAQAASITLNSTVTPVTCFGYSNGIVVVSPTVQAGPIPSYTFAWSPAVSTMTGQSTASVSGLPSNIYSLTLTSLRTGSACVNNYSFNVTQPTSITVSAVTTSLQCNGIPTGSIVATASGGFGSLNYTWTPNPASGSSPTIINLPANTGTNPPSYTLTVTDQNNCAVVRSFTLTEPTPVTSTISFVSASCSNSCNATASLVAGGGTPTYSFSWNTSTVTTSSLGSLCPGTYSGTVTDSHGCSITKSVSVVAPAPLSVTLTPFNPLCNAACNGSITTAVSGAQGTVAYVWAPAGTGQNPTGLCAVVNPVYTLVATDSKTCQVTSVVTLTNPPALLASVTATNPVCHNDLNGLAIVSTTNAVGAGHYTWTPTAPTKTTQSVSGLGFGSYTVFVRDDNNCLANATFTLTNPLAITVASLLSNPTCLQSNGSITVTATGGTTLLPTPYTYFWSGSLGTSPVISGLGAGVYSVTVSDSYSCSTMGTVNLSNANGPSGGSISTTSVSCHAQCTGAATLDASTITGGTSPYAIEWQAPATTTANPTGSLCAGNYIAKITDATGCISFTNTTIVEPLPVSITNSLASFPLCPGICDGTIALNVSGGVAPYTYTWNPISSNAPTETNLCAGDYTVTVGYNSTCQETVAFNMPIQTSITIVPTVTNNICFGQCNGIATVSVSGGTGPYQASWSNAQTGMFANSLCNGDYTVSITDNNGCNNTATTSINSAAQITSSASVSQPSCGMCDGTAGLTVSGGTGPYSFNWSNSATTPSISNLCAGIYQVVISDALSCSQSHTVIVNNSNGITGETFNVADIPCSGQCVGGLSVTALGGNLPIAYNWLNPVSTSTAINNLCPGTYFVQMIDAQGCVRTSSYGINPLVTLTVSPFVQQPSCNASNGSLQIVIAGGTPSYTIVWSPAATNTTALTGLNTGIYSYTVTESGTHSCSVSNTVVISNANGPLASATQTNVDCFGGINGAVAVTASSPSMPLTYSWSTGSTNTMVTNLGGSIITLTITDAALCKTIQSYTITQGTEMHLGFSNINNPTCFGDCDGVITLLPTGGSLPYTYNWSSSVTSNPATSLCDGTYSAVVTDALGCPISSPVFTIASASSMSITTNKTDPSCSATNDGILNIIPAGGSPGYSFNWQGPSAFTATTQNISSIYFGSYTLTVTDSLGCTKQNVLQVVPTITVMANAGFDAIICPITGTAVLDASGSAGSANYKWSVLGQSNNTLAITPNYTVSNLTQPTSFILVATSSVAACFDIDTVFIDLHTLPTVDAGSSAMVPVYSSVTIGGNPTSFSAVSLTWTPAQYLDNANAFNPVASNTINIIYTVTVTDLNGCIESGTVAVDLFPELNVTNGFTPNGDGKNDTWIIDYIEQFPNNTVEIFNRWGDIIFTSKGYQTPFDGKYKGGDLPVGTYYYVIHLNHPGYPKPITGPITIFR